MRNPIDDAIAALRRGDQAKAFALLRGRLTQEPKDATAWLWMSEATPDVHRKMEALERFISLAPDHPRVPSARARLEYLESQVAKLEPVDPPPAVAIEIIAPEPPPPAPVVEPPSAVAPIRTAPPVEPARTVTPDPLPTPPSPRRESLLSGRIRSAPEDLPPIVERTDVGSPMTVSTPPTRAPYKPAMPDLLQSLLDTAPMPRVGRDSSLETAPRPAVYTPAPSAEIAEEQNLRPSGQEGIGSSVADEEVASTSRVRATPWWAWALIGLMALQILLLVYIILRIELLLATVR